jgi:hypothetical protein
VSDVCHDDEDRYKAGARRVSQSQISAFSECPRRWGGQYLGGFKGSFAAASFGSKVHELVECILTEGGDAAAQRAVDASAELALASALAHIVPGHAGNGRIWEAQYYLHVASIDVQLPIKPDFCCRADNLFGDLKTTGQEPDSCFVYHQQPGLTRWGRPAKTLADALQARLYAYGLMLQWRTQKITARWCYGQRGTNKTWYVERAFCLTETREWLEEHAWPAANIIAGLWQRHQTGAANWMVLPPDPNSCGHVGRNCQHLLAMCKLDASGAVPLAQLRRKQST